MGPAKALSHLLPNVWPHVIVDKRAIAPVAPQITLHRHSMLERYAPLPTKSYSRPLRKPTVAAMKQLVDSSNCH
jgi:hypothetical protein